MAESRDKVGPALGLITFLAGVVLLVITFSYAFHLFTRPPVVLLGLDKAGKQPLDLNQATSSVSEVIFKSIMLLVMCAVGSSISGRGIKLYAAAAARPKAADSNSA